MTRILVVEDSPTIGSLLTSALRQDGYVVITAADGSEALSICETTPPDLMLLDIILPKVNGYQVCRTLKENERLQHIPVIMITSKDKPADREWGLEQGADAYITKPVDSEALLDVVHRFIAQPT